MVATFMWPQCIKAASLAVGPAYDRPSTKEVTQLDMAKITLHLTTYKAYQIRKLKFFSSHIAVVSAKSNEARC